MQRKNKFYSFRTDVAAIVGERSATILMNFEYWIDVNQANEKNIHDDHCWTYNSIEAFSEIFYYLTTEQIRYTLNKLEEDGYLLTGNYNKMKYDRTKWYTLTDKYYNLTNWGKDQLHLGKVTNGSGESHKPIPINKPINKPDESVPFKETSFEYGMSKLLYKGIINNGRKIKKPNLQNWADKIRLMKEQDDWTEDEIETGIKFVLSDDFWKGTTLSTNSLRKSFDNIYNQSLSKKEKFNKEKEVDTLYTQQIPTV